MNELDDKTKNRSGFFGVNLRRIKLQQSNIDELLIGLLPYLILFVLIIWLSFILPASFSLYQIKNMINLTMVLLLMAIGQTIVVLTSGIDLSVGGVLSLISVITASMMNTESNVIIVVIILVAFGWLPGLVNGLLVAYGKIQPFIATLATWFVWAGLALLIMPRPGGKIDSSLGYISVGNFLGISNSFWLFFFIIIGGAWFLKTKLGLEIRAIGSDREAAYFSGINVKRIEVIAYSLSSWLTVLGGLMLGAQTLSGDPTVGETYILPTIAATVIGGTQLSGGKGSLSGTAIGAMILTYLSTLVFALRLQPQWAQMMQGLLLISTLSFHFIVHKVFGSGIEVLE